MIASQQQLGIGWRPELAWFIENRRDIEFVELLAENCFSWQVPPAPIEKLTARGVKTILHGTSLSLGGAEPIAADRLDRFARCARMLNCSFISEHIAFVRAGGIESGHLLPVPRTRVMLQILCDNIARAQEFFPVPLVLENIATLFEFPDNEMSEPQFISSILERTNTRMLLDIANLYANSVNHRYSPMGYLAALPLERVEYIHIAGGALRGRLYHDTHCHPVPRTVLELLQEVAERIPGARVMLERDGSFPPAEQLNAELDQIVKACSPSPNPDKGTDPARLAHATH